MKKVTKAVLGGAVATTAAAAAGAVFLQRRAAMQGVTLQPLPDSDPIASRGAFSDADTAAQEQLELAVLAARNVSDVCRG